jgi:hypothetical protein
VLAGWCSFLVQDAGKASSASYSSYVNNKGQVISYAAEWCSSCANQASDRAVTVALKAEVIEAGFSHLNNVHLHEN